MWSKLRELELGGERHGGELNRGARPGHNAATTGLHSRSLALGCGSEECSRAAPTVGRRITNTDQRRLVWRANACFRCCWRRLLVGGASRGPRRLARGHLAHPPPAGDPLAIGDGTRTGHGTATPIKHLVVIFQENVPSTTTSAPTRNATNPSGEPSFHAAPGTPTVNGLTEPLLTEEPEPAQPAAPRPLAGR